MFNTPPIPGYGIAVRWGLEFFRGKSVVIVMADALKLPRILLRFIERLKKASMCLWYPFAQEQMWSIIRRLKLFLNRLGNKLIAFVTQVKYA
jgi:dolichol-phosphate mannosyltransferase